MSDPHSYTLIRVINTLLSWIQSSKLHGP